MAELTKIINWIKFMYQTYELDRAESEIYMFLKRAEMLGLITDMQCNQMLDYSEGKFKLGRDLEKQADDYYKKEGI